MSFSPLFPYDGYTNSQVEAESPEAYLYGPGTPAGLGSNPVEAVPQSQEAMAESETRIDSNGSTPNPDGPIVDGATPYSIIDETAEQKGAQAQAKQLPPFNDPSLFEGDVYNGVVDDSPQTPG